MELLKIYFLLPFLLGCYGSEEAITRVRYTSLCKNNTFTCKSDITRCIPTAWRCDCAYDCDDGSDEEDCESACPTTSAATTPSTIIPYIEHTTETGIPQKPCPEGHKLCDDGKTCIPGLLLCDGILDCPDGSDEKYECENSSLCAANFYFCRGKSPIPCIPRDNLCDGVSDCPDGTDESICDNCTKIFCRNQGICLIIKRAPICLCKPEYGQNRCEKKIIAPDMNEILLKFSKGNSGWIASGSMITILAITVVFFIRYRRKQMMKNEGQRILKKIKNVVV